MNYFVGLPLDHNSYLYKIILNKININNFEFVNQLYQNSYTCLVMFNNLNPISKQILIRILLEYEQRIHIIKHVDYWVKDSQIAAQLKENKQYLDLTLYKIIQFQQDPQQSVKFLINRSFQQQLGSIINGNVSNEKYIKCSSVDKKEMQEKIKEAWLGLYNQINKFGQGTSNYNSENINNVIRKFSPQQQKLGFIMSSTKHQLHSFLAEYTRQLEDLKINNQKKYNIIDIINTIINLSFLDPNYYYQKPEGLSVLEKTIIEDLSQIRLIQKRQQNQNIQFCISELLHNFMLQDPQIKVGINCQIIVETNFMIYIEVEQDKRSLKKPSNDDINSVLDLIKDFCDIKVVFPHMIVAQLTQFSVLKAYKRKQMTSQLIIDFLNKWCSKKRIQYVQEKNKINKQFELRKKQGKMPLEFLKLFQEEYEMPLVPENVIQQLELWEFEKDIYNEEKLEQLGKKQQELDQEEDLETQKN